MESSPSLQEWQALYAEAIKFKELASWNWMWDSDIFGVQDPANSEIGYCCVLGRAGEVFGLTVYLGNEEEVSVGKNKKNDELWKEACRKCCLSTRHIQMAKELGLNPRSLIKNIPNPHQRWKLPVRDWIEEIYNKRFKGSIKNKRNNVNR